MDATSHVHSRKIKAVQSNLREKGVKYCIGAYVDIHGVPKAKVVPLSHLEHMAHGSELYTGYALDGLGQEPNDDEIASVPDLDHIIQLPWEPKLAWMPADNTFRGKPYALNTRVALKNVLAKQRKWEWDSTSASSARFSPEKKCRRHARGAQSRRQAQQALL